MTMTQTLDVHSVDLSKFCGKEDSRFLLTKPFVKNGCKYATDGRICVRIPTFEESNTATGNLRPFPNAESLFGKSNCDTDTPWPSLEFCPQCYNTKTIGCNGCSGFDGEGGCDGCGIRECLMCEGKPSSEVVKNQVPYFVVEIGNSQIQAKYFYLISRLPGAKYSAGSANGSKNPIRIQFDGGECLVMPVSKGE